MLISHTVLITTGKDQIPVNWNFIRIQARNKVDVNFFTSPSIESYKIKKCTSSSLHTPPRNNPHNLLIISYSCDQLAPGKDPDPCPDQAGINGEEHQAYKYCNEGREE